MNPEVEGHYRKAEDAEQSGNNPRDGFHNEIIKIIEGSTGYNYMSIFQRCMDNNVFHVDVYDSYVTKHHQASHG